MTEKNYFTPAQNLKPVDYEESPEIVYVSEEKIWSMWVLREGSSVPQQWIEESGASRPEILGRSKSYSDSDPLESGNPIPSNVFDSSVVVPTSVSFVHDQGLIPSSF